MTSPVSRYEKPFTSVPEQARLMAGRGMNIGDVAVAEATLRKCGYYRLSGYSHLYRERVQSGVGIKTLTNYRSGTTLTAVLALYSLDEELRNILLNALATVEIALRFNIGHRLGRRGAFAHRMPNQLDEKFTLWQATEAGQSSRVKESTHAEWLRDYRVQEKRSQETFVAHFRSKYGPHLPVWVSTEVMSFGTLSRLYNGMLENDRKLIALRFGAVTNDEEGDPATFSNWMNHLRHVRNICAHYGRIWNRTLDVALIVPPALVELKHLEEPAPRKIYGSIAILRFLLARVDPGALDAARIEWLIDALGAIPDASTEQMGFPHDWQEEALWSSGYEGDTRTIDVFNAVDDVEVANGKEARDLLTIKPRDSDRRQWLKYLVANSAVISHKLGPQRYYPLFQFKDGDVRPDVADINEALFQRVDEQSRRERSAHCEVQNWWITVNSMNGFSLPPIEQVDIDVESVRKAAGVVSKKARRTPRSS